MVNEKVYENLTEEKLCFCDERPDDEIFDIIDYLWKDELESYYDMYRGIPMRHIFTPLLKVVEWLRNSTRSDEGDIRDYYTWLLQENRMCEEENKRMLEE